MLQKQGAGDTDLSTVAIFFWDVPEALAHHGHTQPVPGMTELLVTVSGLAHLPETP